MLRGTLVLTVAAILFPSPALFAQIPTDYDFRIDNVTGNRIENYSAPFGSRALYDVVEITRGSAKGDRFFVYDYSPTTLICTGLLNLPTTSVEAAGVHPGDECSVLPTDQIWPETAGTLGTCTWSAPNTLKDSGGAAWATDIYNGLYVYLTGLVDGNTVPSFFTITNTTTDTFSVDASRGGLPHYTGNVSYLIVTNPPVVQTKPQIQLGTNSYPDPICDICIRLGITFTLIPLSNKLQWNPLNKVDPYVAVRITPPGGPPDSGPIFFFHNGRWSTETKPVYRSLVIGDNTSGVLGVFLMGTGLPTGKYTLYGVLNTPGAPLFDERYWRSDPSSTSFFFPAD